MNGSSKVGSAFCNHTILFLSFVLSVFFQTRKNSHETQLFYLSIYLFVLQLTSQKVIYSACRKKKVLSSFLKSFVFLSVSQEKKIFIYFELRVSQVFSF